MQLVKKTAVAALEEIRELVHKRPYKKDPVREFVNHVRHIHMVGMSPLTHAILTETQDLVHFERKRKERLPHDGLVAYVLSRLEKILDGRHSDKDVDKMFAFLVALVMEIDHRNKPPIAKR